MHIHRCIDLTMIPCRKVGIPGKPEGECFKPSLCYQHLCKGKAKPLIEGLNGDGQRLNVARPGSQADFAHTDGWYEMSRAADYARFMLSCGTEAI